MRVFITGGTGMIGTRLVRHLRGRHDVVVLTRHPAKAHERLESGCTIVEGDPTQAGGWMESVGECDAVVNLAGENIFNHRWNDEVKTAIRDSRVRGTENVVQALARAPRDAAGRPKVLVNASAVGYYGPHGDEELTEADLAGDDFLACVCVDWENAARAAEPLGVRVVSIRTGVVLDKEGGALAKLLTPFKWFVGGTVGSGRQWMSWVHHADLIGLYAFALDNGQLTGPVNATAPNPVTNKEFSKALGRALGRPSFLWTPEFALQLMLGEVAGLVTTGQRVLPTKATALGYTFRFGGLDEALRDILAGSTEAGIPSRGVDDHDYQDGPGRTAQQTDRTDREHPHRHAHDGDAGRHAPQPADGHAADRVRR
jgi:uncharacterized protein